MTNAAAWERARQLGKYRPVHRGRTLEEEGFMHASEAGQVEAILNAFYAGRDDLVVLVIDEARVGPEIRREAVPGWDDPFPHVYGPLNVDAVVEAVPIAPEADGRLSFTPRQAG